MMDLYPADSLDEATVVLTAHDSYYRETPDDDTWTRRWEGDEFTTDEVINLIAGKESVFYRPTPDHVKFG